MWYRFKARSTVRESGRAHLEVSTTDILQELPGNWKHTLRDRLPPKSKRLEKVRFRNPDKVCHMDDPVRLVRAYSFAPHLRNQHDIQAALDEAHCLQHEEDDCTRDKSHDVARTQLNVNSRRLYVICMLVQRRDVDVYVRTDAVRALTVFSDASPLAGAELQVTIIDMILKSGDTLRPILPGCTLAYGHQDAVSKRISFVWASWLVAGPAEKNMRFFFSIRQGKQMSKQVVFGFCLFSYIAYTVISIHLTIDGLTFKECVLITVTSVVIGVLTIL